jgi:hypothetical protein
LSAPLPYPFTPFPPPRRRELALPRPRAHLMGRLGARLARTPSRNAHARTKGIFQGEKDSFALQATPTGASPAKGAWPRRLHGRAPNPLAPSPLCPCAALTGEPIPRGRASAGHPPTRIGVLPLFPVRHRKRRRVGGVWRRKEERGREVTSVTPPARQDRRPHQSPRGRKGRSSALGKKPDQSRDQDAAVNAYAAPSSTRSRPQLHRCPIVSTPRPSSSSLLP